MKKMLTPLTGMLVLMTILVACSGPTGSDKENSRVAGDDSKKVDIFLKAVSIDGSMHLEMYDSRDTCFCKVIDGLITEVDKGYTVFWKKAPESNIRSIDTIRPINDIGRIFGKGANLDRGLWKLEIPEDAEPGMVKYEIEFKLQNDPDTTYMVDPYLRIPYNN